MTVNAVCRSPLQVIHLVRELSLLSVLLVRLVLQHLHAFATTRLVLTGLCHRIQLTHLVLEVRKIRAVEDQLHFNHVILPVLQSVKRVISLSS